MFCSCSFPLVVIAIFPNKKRVYLQSPSSKSQEEDEEEEEIEEGEEMEEEEEGEGEENDEDLLSFDYDSVAPKEDPAQFQLPEICLLTAYNPIPPNKQKNNTHNSILTFDSSWRDVSSFIFIHSELFSHRKRLHERHSRLRCEKRGEKRLLPRPA